MNYRRISQAFGLALVALWAQANAGTTYNFEYQNNVLEQTKITALKDDLFGDTVSYLDGGVQFKVTDVTAKTNAKLPLAFGRKLSPIRAGQGLAFRGAPDISKNILGEFWEPDIPMISGIYPTSDSHVTGKSARCTGGLTPSAIPLYPYDNGPPLLPYNFWFGVTASIPGYGEGKLLNINSGTQVPTDGATYKYVTSDNWRVTCLSALKNGPGEGYLVVLPDGAKYYFDWLATRAEPTMYIPYSISYGTSVPRETMFFLPSKAEDRFGNTITYTYDPQNPTRLLKMVATDGAEIDLNYDADGHLASVATGGRQWTYSYARDPSWTGTDNFHTYIAKVTLPDSSAWTFDYDDFSNGFSSQAPAYGEYCNFDPGTMTSSGTPRYPYEIGSLKITHPSGAVGTFTFKTIVHGTNNVTQGQCSAYSPAPGFYAFTLSGRPKATPLRTLISKSISGLGLTTKTWNLTYAPSWSWAYECSSGCPTTSKTTVTSSDGKTDTYVFGSDFQTNAAQLISHSVSGTAGGARTTTNTYLTDPSGQPFPDYIGGYIGDPVGETLDNPLLRRNRPVVNTDIRQDGVDFINQVNTFDALARPVSVTKSSSLGYSRTENTSYNDQLSSWTMGQVRSVTCTAATPVSCAGLVESQTDYDSVTALPLRNYQFGKLQQTLSYNGDGTIATVKDGKGNVTTFSNWGLGIPQTITFPATPDSPAGVIRSAALDTAGNGWITSITDENGYKTCYDYDPMGRVKKITYPSESQAGVCDASTWAPTTITFNSGNAAAYGVPAGHWRQTTLTGNARHILVFDAMWRPLVDQTLDLANVSDTLSEVIKRYDADGHLIFQSYPMNTNGQAVYTDTTLKGSHTTFDALDRLKQVDQDSELGILSTKTAYLAGFKTQVTNPRLFKAITGYMALNEPIYDWPVDIDSADGTSEEADTDIARDSFGKPSSIARHNAAGTVSEKRSYVYNPAQELCKIVEPETGSTLQHFDAAGNLDWSASGLALPSMTSCDDTNVAVAPRKITRSYDARNRLLSMVFPDHRGDTTYHYTPDGKASYLTADNGGSDQVTTNYAYNHRRLLTNESLVWSTINWPVSYGYDANGHLSSQSWHGLLVDYAPNALGQPTKAGTFASGLSYYPNGAIKQFTYGNGIVHTMTQNARQLPDRSQDAYGGVAVLDDSYDYDPNGNVAAISDGLPNARGNRTMTYDGLDRLKDVVSPMYGSTGAHYTYDVLDNLTHVNIGGNSARDQYYCYDPAKWQLTNIKTGSCTGATVIGMGFDLQGNLSNKNGKPFDFDFGNRLRSADTSTYVYDASGLRVRDSTPVGDKYSQYTHFGQLSMTGDGRTNKVDEYVYLGGSLIAIRERDVPTNVYTVKYQHTDALGSPAVVTDPGRVVTQRNEYEPYGKGPSNDMPGHTGQVADAATGLEYMQQRYYDPSIGEFLSVDPVAADPTTGSGFNRYAYAIDNPYKFTDPDGRWPERAACRQNPSLCDVVKNGNQDFAKGASSWIWRAWQGIHAHKAIQASIAQSLPGYEVKVERSVRNPFTGKAGRIDIMIRRDENSPWSVFEIKPGTQMSHDRMWFAATTQLQNYVDSLNASNIRAVVGNWNDFFPGAGLRVAQGESTTIGGIQFGGGYLYGPGETRQDKGIIFYTPVSSAH